MTHARQPWLLLIAFFFITTFAHAQKVEHSIHVDKAGTLISQLTMDEANTITDLTITGKINAVDFKHLRDEFNKLEVLDLSAVDIKSYMGKNGTVDGFTIYNKNSIPTHAFSEKTDYDPKGKPSLRKVILSHNIKSIDKFAFANCPNLCKLISNRGDAPDMHESALSPQRTAIFVPAGCKNNYNTKEPWSQFAVIDTEPVKTNIVLGHSDNLADKLIEQGIQPCNVNYLVLNGEVTLDDLQIIRDYMADLVYLDLRNTNIKHIPDYTFAQKINLLTVYLPIELKSIGVRAFDNCNRLGPELILPSTVTSIEYGAFVNCRSLSTVRALGTNITAVAEDVFGKGVESKLVYSN